MENDMKSLREVSKTIETGTVNELNSFIAQAHNELVNKPNAIIPEVVFVEYFLEFFKNGAEGGVNTTLGLKWIELAGSPFSPVDVVDGEGNVRYTIPGLVARPDANSELNNINFSKIADNYILKSNRLVAEADNYLHTELSGIDKKVEGKNVDQAVNGWRKTLTRYDSDKSEPESMKINTSMDELIDYD